ncbi:MAG: M16 family metallopeptidase [Terriglobales bacterium]
MPRRVWVLPVVLGLLAGAAAQRFAIPPIPFTAFKLSNGMRVILSEDHSLPVVTESLLFAVGGRDEHPGRSGFAHLFEHLMFEGSAHAPKGRFDHLVEGYGGTDNASTHEDYTFYYASVPSNALATVLWLDADRLSALNVTAAAMKNQILVVEEEKRMRVNNAPYGQLMYVELQLQAFANWQNAHPVIGSFKDLDAATLPEVQQFFDEYYAPRNCILTIVGDFNSAAVKQQVEHYFGWIPNRGTITPVDTQEPQQTKARSLTLTDPLAKLPALSMSWQGPKRGSNDYYALTMLGQLLFAGQGSRLYQSLVKDHKVALQVGGGLGFPSGDYTDYRAPGLFSSLVVYKPNATAKQVQQLLMQQVYQIEATGVSSEVLQRLQTKFSSDWIRKQQTTLGRNQMLALAALFDGKPEAANSELAHFLDVSSDDLERVARTFLTSARMNVIVDQPGAAAPAGAQ